MKLKLSILLVLSLLVNNASSICFTQTTQNVFFSELYLGNDNWFVEINKLTFNNQYTWEADSMAISCKSGTSMVKKSTFDAFLKADQYFVFRADSLVAPLHFDNQSDTIKLIFYVNDGYYDYWKAIYYNNSSYYTKAPSEDQSIIFDSYYCEISGYITNQPTPGAANVFKVGENQVTGKNTPLACNPSQNGNAVTISIDAAFDQNSTLVAVYNISGDEVFLRFLTGETSFDIDTESLPAGIYVGALKNNQGTVMTTAFSVQ